PGGAQGAVQGDDAFVAVHAPIMARGGAGRNFRLTAPWAHCAAARRLDRYADTEVAWAGDRLERGARLACTGGLVAVARRAPAARQRLPRARSAVPGIARRTTTITAAGGPDHGPGGAPGRTRPGPAAACRGPGRGHAGHLSGRRPGTGTRAGGSRGSGRLRCRGPARQPRLDRQSAE